MRLRLWAWVALIGLAVALRWSLLVRSAWLLEGDDALSALMALGILDGDRPLMLKNQAYAAAWEPYAMALSFSLFGISRWAAKLPALGVSLAFVVVTWWLAREVAGRAAAWWAAVLAVLPPIYVLVLSLKPWAPYTEVIVLGSLALLAAIRLSWPRPHQRDAVWATACGVTGGLAFWMHPLAVWYLAAAGGTILLGVRGVRLARVVGIGLLGFVVGGLPVWLSNLEGGGALVQFILAGTRGQTADRLAVLAAWWTADLPRAAGLWHPWGPSPRWAGLATAVPIVAALGWAVAAGRDRRRRPRPLDSVLLLLALIPTIYILSGFGGPALNPYGFDATGRYAPPIWGGLAVVIGGFLAAIGKRWRGLGLAAGLLVLVVNALGYVSIDPLEAFQSPYWPKLPADNGPLLAALRAEGIEAVWMNHWAGQPVMFDARAARQPLIAYDWYDVQAGGIDRFPEYRSRVEQADRPAFVLVTDEPRPELEERLDALGVAYAVDRVRPYVIVVPTSRRVHPSEVTPALDYRY